MSRPRKKRDSDIHGRTRPPTAICRGIPQCLVIHRSVFKHYFIACDVESLSSVQEAMSTRQHTTLRDLESCIDDFDIDDIGKKNRVRRRVSYRIGTCQ